MILRLFLMAGFFVCVATQSDETELTQFGRAIKCKRDDGILQRCMPVFENIAFDRDITANNTCGVDGPSEYCVQTGTSGAKKICDICDERNPGQSHPANLMTDQKDDTNPTWWQSETLLENKYGVNLVLDLKKAYNVAFIRIRFHTIRPNSFAIYKKSTYDPNERWLPYQYFSRNCDETYSVSPNLQVTYENQKLALCSEGASGMIPLSGGNVAYLTLDNRPGKKNFDRYPELQDWVTVTSLKFSLDLLNTFGDEVFGDPKVLKSYYFAVSDIAVGGRCKCHGHASKCSRNQLDGTHYCECDHNTAGRDCEKCLPLYNDQPWQQALGKSVNACQKCNCNGLADECVFDEQLWIDSGRATGGRCLNCQENTDGIHCERCRAYHYRGANEKSCKPCNCDKVGSRSQSCNSIGVCPCKYGVTGDKCDRCLEGYYDLSNTGCKKCDCNKEGSIGINCNAIGQCKCKDNVNGLRCDQCKANHFDLDKTNPLGCKACFCYGHGTSCTSMTGVGAKLIKTTFETDVEGWELHDENGNKHPNKLEWDNRSQHVLIEPIKDTNLYLVAPRRYLGNRLSSYAQTLTFVYGIFIQPEDPAVIVSQKDIILEGAGLTATYEITQGNSKPTNQLLRYQFHLIEPKGMKTFDFQKLLSDLTAIKIRVTYLPLGHNPVRRSAIDTIYLESSVLVDPNTADQVSWQEKCNCEVGYTGDQCEACAPGYTRENQADGKFGKCVPCACNNHGNECDPETGVCVCKDNTAGRNCELCKPGFYGNPSRGTSDDCQRCPCIFANECVLLGNRIKCTDCPEGHEGDRCEKCKDKYFGDPQGQLGNATRCQKCDCSGNVDSSATGNCDGLTGGCLKCIYNTKNGPGQKCELCADGFYGDALAEPKGNCSACNCFENGTKTSVNHKPGTPISCDDKGKCICRENVIGDRCNMCPAGHWNVKSGTGCEKCSCHPDGSIGNDCDIETGKCKCKPGVSGRTCNQCAAGFYKFSKDGCRACNCHPDGSRHQNCTSDGVCECLPGVLGIKCDQCPENKFNLSVGCIACPKCFELIQIAVNKLREKLSTFNFTKGNYTNKDPGIDIRDKDFELAIKALEKAIKNLREKTDKLLQGDMKLFDYFKQLSGSFEQLTSRYDELSKMVEKSKGASETGQTAIEKAEEIIEMIKTLLKLAEKKLKEEGDAMYKNAITNADTIDETAKRMQEIAEEARQLADRHQNESVIIKMTTDMAYNTSVEAYSIAKEAKEKELRVNSKLKDTLVDATEAHRLSKESRDLINQAEKTSNTTLAEAEILINDGKKPLPDFGINETNAKADSISNRATFVDRDSKKLVKDNQPAVEQLALNDEEARRLMAGGDVLIKKSNDLYEVAKNASDEAIKARQDGLKVAQEAKDMLDTLLGFNEIIAKSKANATEALKLIDTIRRLIKEANDTAKAASKNADNAEGDSLESLNIAKTANDTTQMAMRDLDDIMREARQLLNQTKAYAAEQVTSTEDLVKNTTDKLNSYMKQANADAELVAQAKNRSSIAVDEAIKARDDLEKALADVMKLMMRVESLDEIDMATLEDAERRFQQAKDTIEGTITVEIEALEKKVLEQNELIKRYELDLDPLRKQIAHVQKLASVIPTDRCYKPPGSIENQIG